jgi:hypothetical protein
VLFKTGCSGAADRTGAEDSSRRRNTARERLEAVSTFSRFCCRSSSPSLRPLVRPDAKGWEPPLFSRPVTEDRRCVAEGERTCQMVVSLSENSDCHLCTAVFYSPHLTSSQSLSLLTRNELQTVNTCIASDAAREEKNNLSSLSSCGTLKCLLKSDQKNV